MDEIKLTKANHVQVLQAALEVLRAGGVIVYPSETSYGLGCDFFNQTAVDKVYKIKNRNRKMPLLVLVSDIVQAASLVDFSDVAHRLANQYWPGPLTLVLPYKYCDWKNHCDEYLALRVSSNVFASNLTISLGSPLVSTSANVSGQGDCYSAKDIKEQFKGAKFQPDLLINAGKLPQRPPTTVIKFEGDKGEILRQGEIKIKL